MAKNWALVIGINGYNPLNFSPLRYAKRDAEQVKALFEEVGFDQVCLFTDDSPPLEIEGFSIPTQPTYGNLISFFEDRFKNPFLSTGDNCWFFFAGHGERHGDKDYLMPMDANSRGTKVLAGLQVDEVREWLTRSGADNVILLLDACRNEGSRGAQGIDPSEQKGVITISSCNPTQVAWEIEELQHGAFTYALLEALRLPGERSCATVERLGNYVKHRVPDLCQQYKKIPPQIPRVHVDPLEKQHFILMPQFARQADIDLMKKEGFRLAFESKVQLAEQMFIRANVAARGLDAEIIQALRRLYIQMASSIVEPPAIAPPTPTNEPPTARSPIAETLSVGEVVAEAIATNPNPSKSPPNAPAQRITPFLPPPAVPSAGRVKPPQPSVSPPPNSGDDIPLTSEKGIDYTKLRDLLKAQDWKAADYETHLRMLEAVGRKKGDWIRGEELLNFPCADLKTIDELWMRYSEERFGFSVQRRIYIEFDGHGFGELVRWQGGGKLISYENLCSSLFHSQGTLPRRIYGGIRGGRLRGGYISNLSSLMSRFAECG